MVAFRCGMFAWITLQTQQTKLLLDLGFTRVHSAFSLSISATGGKFRRTRNMLKVSNHWRVRKHWTAQ